MEHQTPEGSNQPHFIIPHIQGPNPSHELCPLPEELSANIGVNFSSSATTEAHWAHLQLLASQQSQQALLGTLYSSISPFDVARSSHLRSGEILAENIELSQSQSPALMLDISQNQYLLQAAQVPNNNNALFPVDQFTQNTCSTNETLNTYHLPLSTLPPEFRVPSSSRFSGQQLHPQVSMPLGNISDLRLMNADIAHAQGISYPVRSQGIQGHPNLAAGSNSSNLDGGSSSYSLYPLVSGQKRKTILQVDSAPRRRSWNLPQLRNDQGHRYSLYDPMYGTIGQPVDPHLRFFALINRNNGNGTGN